MAPSSLFEYLLNLFSPTVADTGWHAAVFKMPNIPDLKDPRVISDIVTSEEPFKELNASEINATRRPHRFGQPEAALNVPNTTIVATTEETNTPVKHVDEERKRRQVHNFMLEERQSCPSGSAFYVCQNGFKGCCSVDPCNPGQSCPESQISSTAVGTTVTSTDTATASSKATSTQASSTTIIQSSTRAITTVTSKASTSITSATSSGTASSTTSSVPLATPPPACPAGNGTTFADSSKIDYTIHCNQDNSAASSKTIQVGTGGYGECFSACSLSSTCAGFTFVGLDAGDCYLKSAMPNNTYVAKAGSNYVSCAKVNATAVADRPTPSDGAGKTSGGSKAGAIAGGVIGGLAFLALLLFLIAFLSRRKRKKVEEKRATITHNVLGGPYEPQDHNFGEAKEESILPTHTRQRSTANDVFAPYGGFYRGYGSTGKADEAMAAQDPRLDGLKQEADEKPITPPGLKREGSGYILRPGVYRQPGANQSADPVAMLDGTPIQRPVSQGSRSGSPSRFREHIAEMDGTSRSPPRSPPSVNTPVSATAIDSPTLGRESGVSAVTTASLADEVRRRQHLMSWNNYDPGAAVGRAGAEEEMRGTVGPKGPPAHIDEVSPDLSGSPSDGKYVVSPFGSIDRR